MITEDYVSFDTAKLLKEKGFDEIKCNTCYKWNGNFCNNRRSMSGVNNEICYQAPALQMAMKWLREKGFHIFAPLEIDYDEDERGTKWYHQATYYFEIRRLSDGKIMYHNGLLYTTPEQACEAAIKYCLENLI